MINCCSLQTGSNGNCFYVETPDTRLLFDAGISGRQAKLRLAEHQRDIHAVDALLISHHHQDHVGHAGVFNRVFKIPMHISAASWRICKKKLGRMNSVNYFDPGQTLQFKDTTIVTIATPHDGMGSVAFIISYQDKNLGIFTDLGHCFDELGPGIAQLDAVFLESNYDPIMLADGSYPPSLKERITGNGGHISNQQASQVIKDYGQRLQFVVLSHLSEHNNTPELAINTAREILGDDLAIHVGSRSQVSAMFEII
ncbi:MAG: MBL fold metallo-hydrolase [Phycisphaerae bacterium]|nr:MBL fold metallo-hydrolase [Phycisphaerae bacterium]